MFLTSTRLTLIPHLSVASSSIAVICELISSRLVRVSSRVMLPMILRRVVADRFSIAAMGRSTPYVKSFASNTEKNTTESTIIVTLSFVMTGCGSKSATCSLSETFFTTL